jgi:hypothetical protein
MKQSSKLLLASLLSINLATVAMDQAPAQPIESFIEEIKAFNNTELSMYKSQLKGMQFGCTATLAHLEEFGTNIHASKGFAQQAASDLILLKMKPCFPGCALSKKYGLPLAHFDNIDTSNYNPSEATLLHPSVLSLFSSNFQALINRRKSALINQKLEDKECIENWTQAEKLVFGVALFNTELKALQAELLEIHTKVTPFLKLIEKEERDRSAQGPQCQLPLDVRESLQELQKRGFNIKCKSSKKCPKNCTHSF